MKKTILILVALMLTVIPVSAEITTEVDCVERHWFWYDYTCHENEVQESFDAVTNYINAQEGNWLKDSSGTSLGTVIKYIEGTFWDKINELIDNKLDERQAVINLGWEYGEESIELETTRIRAMRTKEFTHYNDYVCSPEGSCLRSLL